MKSKTKSLLLITAAALLFIAGGLFANYRIRTNLQHSLIDDYAKQEKTISEQVASSVQDRVTNIKNSLLIMARDPVLQGATASCNQRLQTYYDELDLGIGNLGRVGTDGNFKCSLNAALVGTSASKLGNYLDPLFQQDDHPIVVSRQLKVPKVEGYVVAVHVPVYDAAGKFTGSLGGAIYLDDMAKNTTDKVKFAETGFAGMQDDNGDLLIVRTKTNKGKNVFDPEIQKRIGSNAIYNEALRKGYKGESSIARYVLDGTTPKVAAITPVKLTPGHNWIIVVNVPESEVIAIFNKSGLNKAFNAVTAVYVFTVLVASLLYGWSRMRDIKLQQTKDEFIALASHELRTPATAVKNYLGLMKEGYAGEMNEEQKEYVQGAFDANEEQLSVINQLLQTARTDSGRLKASFFDFDIVATLQGVLHEQSLTIESRNQDVKTDIPEKLMVRGDPDLIRLLLQNLVSNASKYTAPGGVVEIVVQEQGTNVTLSVKDSGVGISPKDQKKLFKKFSRIKNPLSHTVGGTGLGLYLTKQIADLHSGTITVESKLGTGTTFTYTMPKKEI